MKLKLKKDKLQEKNKQIIKEFEKEASQLKIEELVHQLSLMTQRNIELQQPFVKATSDIKELKDKEMIMLRDGKKKEFDAKLLILNKIQETINNDSNNNALRYEGYHKDIENRINNARRLRDYKFNGRNLWNIVETSMEVKKLKDKEETK